MYAAMYYWFSIQLKIKLNGESMKMKAHNSYDRLHGNIFVKSQIFFVIEIILVGILCDFKIDNENIQYFTNYFRA